MNHEIPNSGRKQDRNINSLSFFSLYKSYFVYGEDEDTVLDKRFTSEDAARQAAKDIEKIILDEGSYTMRISIIQETLEEPYQEVVYEAVYYRRTGEPSKWRTVIDRMEGIEA